MSRTAITRAMRAAGGFAFVFGATLSVNASAWAAGDAEGGLPQLDLGTFPTQIFWLIISFGLLYWIMTKMAVPRIAEVLEERQDRISDDLETAERLNAEAKSVQDAYEQALSDARAQAHGQIKAANDALAAEQAKAEAEHAKKMSRKTKTAETKIAKQRDEALESLMAVASEVAAEATAKLIGVTPDEASVKKTVEAVTQEGRA